MSSSKDRAADGAPVRVGLVGLGGHGRNIRRVAAEAHSVEVAAVFDLDEEVGREAAAELDCEADASYEALLARDDLEAVVLVTPNHLHRQQTEQALRAGKHVLVEKPIANTVRDGRAMIEAAEAAGRVLMVGHNQRRNQPARRTREALEENRLGKVVSAEIRFSADGTRRMGEGEWRLRPEQCPLLPVVQLGIHAIDLMHFLVGPIQRVHAQTQSVTTPPGVVDSVTATFRIPADARTGRQTDVLGTLVSNYCTPVAFDYRLDGTEGTLRCTPHRFWFRSAEDTDGRGQGPAETHDLTGRHAESYRRQMDAFGEAVRTGEPPETDGPAALQALAVVEALQHSAEQGAPQSVPLMGRKGQLA